MKNRIYRSFLLLLTVLLLLTACRGEEDGDAPQASPYGPVEAGYFEKRKISFFDTQVSVQNLFMEDDCFFFTCVSSYPTYQFRRYDPATDQWSGTDLVSKPHLFARSKEAGFLIGVPEYERISMKIVDYTLTAMKGEEVLWSRSALDVGCLAVEHIADYNGQWVLADDEVLVLLDREGNPTAEHSLPAPVRKLLITDGLLRIIGERYYLEMDESGVLRKNEAWEKATANIDGPIYPAPGYSFCYYTADALMVCDAPSGQTYPLLYWAECGMQYNPSAVGDGSAGQMIFVSPEKLYMQIYQDGKHSLYQLNRNDAARPQREVIRITYLEDGTYTVPQAAAAFNTAQEKYLVQCDKYESSVQTGTELLAELDKMILAGTVGDIIQLNDINDLYKYANKGLLADLYSLGMESVTADNIFGCVRNALETEGKLYALPQGFHLDTLSAKKTTVADRSVWTLDAYMDIVRGCSAEQAITVYAMTLNPYELIKDSAVSGFVDWKGKSCSFDSPDFLRFLEFAREYHNQPDKKIEWMDNPFLADQALLYWERLREGPSPEMLEIFGGEEVAGIVGYPSVNGGISLLQSFKYYGINADSTVTEGAKAFLEFLLSPEGHPQFVYHTPSLKSTAEARFAARNDDRSPDDDNYLSREEMAEFWRFLEETPVAPILPKEILTIVNEELTTFFGGGQSAENTARYIQNRVSTYLSEQS